jgi:curved DNA-binding protein
MAERDFYKTLGVARTATEAEIRKAYRALARKYHPDKNPGNAQAEETFKEISHARDVLLNKPKRQLYDEFGEMGLKEGFNPDTFRQYRSGGGSTGGGFGTRDLGDLEDLLGGLRGSGYGRGSGGFAGFQDFMNGETVQELFRRGARGGRAATPAKQELVSEVTLGFVDALRGGEREVLLSVPGEKDTRSLKVRIPRGVRDGGQIRLRGQGIDGGDVVLKIHVEEHPFWKREADDLLLQLPVTVGEAYRGGKISVPTLDGEVSLTLPRGAKSGAKLRLRGKGVARGDSTGDMIVTVLIRVPDETSAEVERIVGELDAHYGEGPRAGLKL